MFKKVNKILLSVMGVFAMAGITGCSEPKTESANAKPVDIELANAKTEFAIGEPFSTGDLQTTIKYDDDSTRLASNNEITVDSSKYNSDLIGPYEIVVSLNDTNLKKEYTVFVKNTSTQATPESVKAYPIKTEYELGEAFDASGVALEVTYSDKTKKWAKSSEIECDFSQYNANVPGVYTIVASLKNTKLKDTFSVTVKKSTIQPWDEDGALKILMIGNSFSDDASSYVYQIATSLGIKKVVVGNLFIGGCTLDTHLSNAMNNSPSYEYRLNTSGSFVTQPSYRMSTAIEAENWDFISFQQASGSSGEVNTYNALTDLIAYVRNLNKTAKFVWHMTWAYQQNSSHGEFSKYDKDQMTMYNKIVEAVELAVKPQKEIGLIIPNGTAIQNARTSTVGDNLTRDGYHLSLELGRYIAGLTLVQTLTGKSVENIAYAPVSGNNKTIAIESATNACNKPYEVTKSRY